MNTAGSKESLQGIDATSPTVGLGEHVAGVKKKHQRHGDELNKLEELLGNLRSTGMVFIFSARDDAYVMLPLI